MAEGGPGLCLDLVRAGHGGDLHGNSGPGRGSKSAPLCNNGLWNYANSLGYGTVEQPGLSQKPCQKTREENRKSSTCGSHHCRKIMLMACFCF